MDDLKANASYSETGAMVKVSLWLNRRLVGENCEHCCVTFVYANGLNAYIHFTTIMIPEG